MSLAAIIMKKIKAEGPVPFRDFMEMALYHPELGYYTSPKNKIGKKGDYYTACQVSTVLGELLGKQLEEMWNILDKKNFTIIKYGEHGPAVRGTGTAKGPPIKWK